MNRPGSGIENRRYGRLKGPGIACSAGMVIDLSAGGVRIFSKRRLKGQIEVVFDLGDQEKLGVKCRIVWCRRIGFRAYLVGLQFIDLPLSAAKRLLRQGACTRIPKKGEKITHSSTGIGPLFTGLSLCLLGMLLHVGTQLGWWDLFNPPASIRPWLDLISEPVMLMGVGVLVFALIRLMKRPGVETRVSHAQRLNIGGADRRDSTLILDSILESALGGVLILQAIRDGMDKITDFLIQTANPASEHLLGRSTEELVGQRLKETLPCLGSEGLFDKAVSVVETGLPCDDTQKLEHDKRWYRYTAVKLGDGLSITFDDISEQRRSEEKLRHAAYHDALTGLPNRKLLTEHLIQALHRAERIEGYKFAVLFLDFDRFKIINDSLGHEAGDQLLLNITNRLRENLRKLDTMARLGDGHLPSRLGGDEFVVLLDGVRDEHSAAIVAQRLLDAFKEPYQIMGHEVTSTASIGIVVSDPRYTKPDDILRDADTAMYQAKSAGKARYVVFDEDMHKSIVNRLTLENELRVAVETEAFEVVYEPIVCLATGRLHGLEALIRWPHPRRGEISPSEFIEIAEELGLMGKMGRWIMRQACLDFVEMCEEDPDYAPEFINVNVSRTQLRDPGLVGHVNAIMLETKIKPGQLRLEITESMVMDDLEHMAEVLGELKELGVYLAMDDFGTGHSSLTCLHKFPIDVLKIDRSFINSVGRKERYYGAILHSVIELAKNLDMTVIAEGVETANQLALLQGLSCQYGQGYLFSEPVSADNARPLLTRDFTKSAAA